jgi:hypothetical protein
VPIAESNPVRGCHALNEAWHETNFLSKFAGVMADLKDMASRELAQLPFTWGELDMVRNVVERSLDYAGVRRWNGWYPGLYYTSTLNRLESQGPDPPEQDPECDIWDALVADVHTDLPDLVVNDPGAVIHEGVGNVLTMLIAVDNGLDRMVYAGPVFSHYEFEMPAVVRMSDSEWKANLREGKDRGHRNGPGAIWSRGI